MKRLVRWCIATAIIAGVILVLGDARDPWLWGYIATFSLIGAYAMYAIDDDLAKERFTPPSKAPIGWHWPGYEPSRRPTSSSASPTAGSDGRASPTYYAVLA